MTQQPVPICASCRTALDLYTDEHGGHYRHTVQDSPADHEPIPVSADPAWRGRCDFCNADQPAFVLPARDFKAPYLPGVYSAGAWAACSACAGLIDANRWSQLERRALAALEHTHGSPLALASRTALHSYYQALRRNITGPLITLPEPRDS